jgi:hypothetical protein
MAGKRGILGSQVPAYGMYRPMHKTMQGRTLPSSPAPSLIERGLWVHRVRQGRRMLSDRELPRASHQKIKTLTDLTHVFSDVAARQLNATRRPRG